MRRQRLVARMWPWITTTWLVSILALLGVFGTRHIQGTLLLGRVSLPSFLSRQSSRTCGPLLAPCPASAPCCHRRVCQIASPESCSVALGCRPAYSFDPLDQKVEAVAPHQELGSPSSTTEMDPSHHHRRCSRGKGCLAPPRCPSFEQEFMQSTGPLSKGRKLHHSDGVMGPDRRPILIPKSRFKGDPNQARWVSEFDEMAPHAHIDTETHKLVLRAKRDKVQTQDGGGYGATVSSTCWLRYGTVSAKIRSGATGPGIVTAMMLWNPVLNQEISVQVTGRDPESVITDLYQHGGHSSKPEHTETKCQASPLTSPKGSSPPNHSLSGSSPWAWPMTEIRKRGQRLGELVRRPKNVESAKHDFLTNDTTDQAKNDINKTDNNDSSHDEGDGVEEENVNSNPDKEDSLEETHSIKKNAAEQSLVYTIEWTPDYIKWSVDGRVLRTLTGKDMESLNCTKAFKEQPLLSASYIPSEPMLLQFSIWDGGYDEATRVWAGGRTDYGPDNTKEYSMTVDWIKIKSLWDGGSSATIAERSKSWPGAKIFEKLKSINTPGQEQGHEEKKSLDKNAGPTVSTWRWPFKTPGPIRGALSPAPEPNITNSDHPLSYWFHWKSHISTNTPTDAPKKRLVNWPHRMRSRSKRRPNLLGRFVDWITRRLLWWTTLLMTLVGGAAFLTDPERISRRSTPHYY